MPATPATVSAIAEITRTAWFAATPWGPSGWTVTFSKDTLQGLSDGSIKLMGGGHAAAVDSTTSQIVELGKLTGRGAVRGASAWPMMLAGGAAIAAAVVQQQQVGAALAEVSAGIDRLY